MDVVPGEAVEALADELRRNWPGAVRALHGPATPAPPTLDQSEAINIDKGTHPGNVGHGGEA